MTVRDIEMLKEKSDQLVASYSALALSSRFEEAIEHLINIWALDPIDTQILLPRKSIGVSNALGSVSSYIKGSSKIAAAQQTVRTSIKAGLATGGLKEKAINVAGQFKSLKGAAISTAKFSINVVKANKVVAIGVGSIGLAGSATLGITLKKQLREFNNKCYDLAKSKLS